MHPRERFEFYIEETPTCWLWTGQLHQSGYGTFYYGDRKEMAHRVAWEWWNDQPVPEGLVIRHTCDVRRCVRPDHLIVGTRAENSADMVRRGRSTRKEVCLRGHRMEGHNLMESVVTRKVRECRECHNLRVRRNGARHGITPKSAAAWMRQHA